MAAIARSLKVIKSIGDCLIFYFPRTSDPSNKSAFDQVFECCITMMDAHSPTNEKLHEEGWPSLSYRISADYGRVEITRSTTSHIQTRYRKC